MGGRDAEMTFGIGKISYTVVFHQIRTIDKVCQMLVS